MIQSSVEFFKNLPPKQCTECGKKLKNSTNVMETTVIIAFLESSSLCVSPSSSQIAG